MLEWEIARWDRGTDGCRSERDGRKTKTEGVGGCAASCRGEAGKDGGSGGGITNSQVCCNG